MPVIDRRIANRAMMVAAFAATAGCTALPRNTADVIYEPPVTRASPAYRPKEARVVGPDASEWGLAFSGGGLRSAIFNVGVAKALFDAGILERTGAISSVSGGSYASSWLYMGQRQAAPESAFGSAVLADDVFPRSVCELLIAGNFVTYGMMLKAAALPGRSFVDLYEESIIRTFGGAVGSGSAKPMVGLNMQDLLGDIESGRSPFLIINATVHRPKVAPWEAKLFEFTPLGAGNETLGRVAWRDTKHVSVVQAVAISGAAIKPALKQTVPLELPNAKGSRELTLSDGGHSENLGAAALIRRGVKNIIVVDAEHDPEYGFGAYRVLRDGLRSTGLVLTSAELDRWVDAPSDSALRQNPLSRSVHVAHVHKPQSDGRMLGVSTIYYIKMSMSQSLERIIADTGARDRGGALNQAFRVRLDGSALPNGDWQCDKTTFEQMNVRDWAIHSVNAYRVVRPPLARVGGFLHYSFPHMSTGDQSYYNDQALAVLGLGYLEGAEAAAAILSSAHWPTGRAPD